MGFSEVGRYSVHRRQTPVILVTRFHPFFYPCAAVKPNKLMLDRTRANSLYLKGSRESACCGNEPNSTASKRGGGRYRC
jgi:hypothetical protein